MSQQPFVTSEVVSGQSAESYKVMYKPYQNDVHKKIPVTQEGMRRNEVFEDLHHEFSGNDESKQFIYKLERELKTCVKSPLEINSRLYILNVDHKYDVLFCSEQWSSNPTEQFE